MKPIAFAVLIALAGLCTVPIGAAAAVNNAIVLTLEEPASGSIYSGVTNIRGWAVAPVEIVRIELFIDGDFKTNIPYGGTRKDVGDDFPAYPNADQSGFSMAYNYSNLAAGSHRIDIRAVDINSDIQETSVVFHVTRFNNSFISDSADISLAESTVTKKNTSIVINNVRAEGRYYDLRLDWRTAAQGFVSTEVRPVDDILDIQAGDPLTCFMNPEFIQEGNYAVWFEPDNLELQSNNTLIGKVWHCTIDPETGYFIPPDCRGFQAFDSTEKGRANIGADAQGAYYVGMNRDNKLVMVRPDGPHNGSVTVLDMTPDPERRGIYPTRLFNSNERYVLWLKQRGTSTNPQDADWVELRYIDMNDPRNEIIVERQEIPRGRRFAAMDLTFPRWFDNSTVLIYGVTNERGEVQVSRLDVATESRIPRLTTNDFGDKLGTFPTVYQNNRYLLAGLDATPSSTVHRESFNGDIYPVVEMISPPNSAHADPCIALSHEPFIFDGQLFTSYQLADCQQVASYWRAPGEIWVSSVLASPQQQWRVSRLNNEAKLEPEPFAGISRAWVFYTAYPENSNPLTTCWQLRRADTPLQLN